MAGISINHLFQELEKRNSVLSPIIIVADPGSNLHLILNKCAGRLRVYENEIRNSVLVDEETLAGLKKDNKTVPYEKAQVARFFLSFFFKSEGDVAQKHLPKESAWPYDAPNTLKYYSTNIQTDQAEGEGGQTTLVIDDKWIDLDSFTASVLSGLNCKMVISPPPECELVGVLIVDDPELAIKDAQFRMDLLDHLHKEYEPHLHSDYARDAEERKKEVGDLFANCAKSWSENSMSMISETVKSKNFRSLFEYLNMQEKDEDDNVHPNQADEGAVEEKD